jgi:hypothetical protein
MADTLAEITIGYAEGPLVGPAAHGLGGPAPGARAAPVDGQTPVGSGDAPRFALFAAAGAEAEDLIRAHPDLLELAPRPPFAPDGLWLVRPDGYVAAVARSGEGASIGRWLDALRGQGEA